MTGSSQRIEGHHWDAEKTKEAVKAEIDAALGKAEKISKTASKTAVFGFMPLIFSGISLTMQLFGLPQGFCDSVAAFGGAKTSEYSEAAADYCAKTSTKVCQTILHKGL